MMMKAVIANGIGGPDVLEISNIEIPSIKDNNILIKVAAVGINRPDIIQRNGLYPPPAGASEILGLECAGTIEKVGKNVTQWHIGDKICALLSGGGYAEYAVADQGSILPIPNGLSMVEAAALPETFFTVWSNVFDRGQLKKNETILIHGGTSGIGTAAIQMAKIMGAKVITTSGSDEKCNFCTNLGADLAINYKSQNFHDEIMKFTDNNGVNVILDMVAGDYMSGNLKSLSPEGQLVIIAVLGGPKVDFNILPVMLKRLTITGSTLRPRDNQFKAEIAAHLKNKIWPLIESGNIKPVIDKTFTLEDIVKAHRYMDSGGHMGKVILKI
jgi:putative PIG3 family NAD(P)H quinone oxidoreductase